MSPKNPLKEWISAGTGEARLEAARQAVARHPDLKVKVDDIELHLPAPSYSIKTLDALKAREPENDFTMVMGADNLAVIRRWKDYRRILTEYGAVVFPRKGFDLDNIEKGLREESEAYKILLAKAPLVNISSTEIREAAAKGQDISHLLM